MGTRAAALAIARVPLPTVAPGKPPVQLDIAEWDMITNDRFNTITVKELDGRWVVRDADGVTLYAYTAETAAKHKAELVRRWRRKVAS